MRSVLRHAVFALSFSLGSTAWYILSPQEPAPAHRVQVAQEPAVNQVTAPKVSEEAGVLPGQSIKFVPVEPITGYANTETIVLRESANANAPVVARLKAGDFEALEILGVSGEFLRIRVPASDGSLYGLPERKQEYTGWTTWSFVVTDLSAIVLDAETGSVVARVPLSEGLSSVIFSPDGSRAIFSGERNGGSQIAYEVQTSDYTLTRSLTSPEKEPFSALFYAPASGDLYARIYASSERLMRIVDASAQTVPTDIAPDLLVSRDGLTGLIARREAGDDASELTIDMLDLATLAVRNTFKLRSENLSVDGGGFVLNKNGSELYVRLGDSTGAISVIDTRTGQVLRELKESATEGWSHFWSDSVVGDSLLLRVWDQDGDEMHEAPTRYWIGNGSRMLAQTGIEHAVEAGGNRYAVNEEGTLLFKLNANNRIQKRLMINRPDRREDTTKGSGFSVFGLSASPDGKHLIMFVGMASGC